MMGRTGVDKKLWDYRWMAAVFAGALLSILVLGLVIMSGPARAVPGDPCPDCVVVHNPPEVTVNSSVVTINEGTQVTNAGTYDDTSDDDSDTVSITVKDSGGQTLGSVTGGGFESGTWNWSYTPPDGPSSQTLTVTARDSTNRSSSTTFTLNVNNVAPTVNLQSGSFSSVPEGGSFAKGYSSYGYNILVSDPGNDTWTVNTGCGANGSEWFESTTQVWCGFFDGPGSSTVSATATDSDGFISNTASVNVNVTNMNPQAALEAPASINEGQTATISLTDGNFSFQDGETDTNAGFHYAFDCNGGSLTTAAYGNSGTANSTTCPTTDNGTKTVRAKIMDKDGGSNEYTKNITVNNVAPTATINAPASVNQGNNFTVSLGSVSDPSSADTLTYAFDCGNGAGYGTPISTPSTTCNAADKPTLTVKGKVMDDDGGSNEYTKSVNVNNVFPTGTIQVNGGAPGTNNAIVNLTLSATDPPPGSNVGMMRFRNEDTTTWSAWEPYATSRPGWQLSSGDGTKTVFVEYKDNAQNVSQGIISDQILLDTTDSTAPTVIKWTPKTKKTSPTANVIATFSEKMSKASVEAANVSGLPTTFTLKKKGTTKTLAATVTYSEPTATTFKAVLNPTGKLRPGATYTATVTSAATDLVGNPLVKKTWTFTVKS
jgi:Bacterial Ig-like domain